jgi:hypothetical protein
MINEIRAAVEWLLRTIEVADLSEPQLQRFEWALVDGLTRKYTDHWYQDMPWRGQGYRSILSEDCDNHVVDHVLRNAAQEACINDLPSRMPSEAFVIWVDPGDVEVRFLKSHRTELLYHQPSTYNPYAISESSAATHRHSMVATPSSSMSSSHVTTRQPQPHHRVRSLEEVDVDGASALLADESMGYTNPHLNASDSAVLVSHHHQQQHHGGFSPSSMSPPRQNAWGYNKSPSKFNLRSRPWEPRTSSGAPSWGPVKTGPRSMSPVGV